MTPEERNILVPPKDTRTPREKAAEQFGCTPEEVRQFTPGVEDGLFIPPTRNRKPQDTGWRSRPPML